jgi:DNA polymerase V
MTKRRRGFKPSLINLGIEPLGYSSLPLESLSDLSLSKLYSSNVQAGFPSPADDYIEKPLDLNTYLISDPTSTFFVKVTGDSMKGDCICDGNILIVDKSKEAINGSIVIAVVDGEFTVKRLKIINKKELILIPSNDKYDIIKMREDSHIWGVVTTVISKV